MVSEAEKALVKYIPSYYHLLIKSDTMTPEFENALAKMQINFKKLRKQAGISIENKEKAADSATHHAQERERLAAEIAEAKSEIQA